MRYPIYLFLLAVLIVTACGDGDTTGTRVSAHRLRQQ